MRRTLAVACSTAVVATAGAAFFAAPAGAAVKAKSTLAISGSTNVTSLNLAAAADATAGGNYNMTLALGAASYGVRVTSSVGSKVYLKILSQPSGGKLYADAKDTTSAPLLADDWTPLSTGGTAQIEATGGNGRVFLAADTVGAYTFQMYEDVDGGGALTSGDNTSAIVTLTAKAPNATAGSTTWTPTVTMPSTMVKGTKVPVNVDLTDLTLTDARGGSAIATALANLIGVTFTGQGAQAITVSNVGGTSAYLLSAATAAAGTATSAITFDSNGDGTRTDTAIGGTSTAITADNGVTGLGAISQVDVSGSVGTDPTTGTQTDIKGGVATATYKVTATGAAPADVVGDYVYFTLVPTAGTSTSTVTCSSTTPTLTADGSLIATYGDGRRLYSAITNSAGVAYLTVRSSDTAADCSYYTVNAASNGQFAGGVADPGTTRTAKYLSAKPSAFAVTNTSAELLPAVGTNSVILKGSLTDQWGVSVPPLASDTQQASLTVGGSSVWVSANNGTFSYTYTPTTAPTSATAAPFSWSYTGTTAGGPYTKSGTITWTSTSAAAAVTLSTPVNGAATLKLSSSDTVNPGQDGTTFGDVNGQVTGFVTDAAGAVLPYKKVTLTGGDGVYFSTASNGSAALVPTMDVVTNSSGQFSGAYAFFTKAGTPAVTATADGKSATATVTTATSSDGYIVSVNDAFGMPGAIAITGRVVDVFGNPVPNRKVDVAVTPAGSGTLAATPVTTTTDGSWTATWTASAGVKGDFVVTATMYNAANAAALTSNPVASTTWSTTAHITGLPAGQYKDTGKVTVGPVILSGPTSRAGAGMVRLIGVSNPNSTVEIYGRPAGSAAGLVLFGTVIADGNGDFQADEYLTTTTSFVAKMSGTSQYSSTVTVVVTPASTVKKVASVSVTAKALGSGKVKFTVNGAPNTKGTITLYMGSKKVKSWTSNAYGDGGITVKTTKGKKTFKAVFAPAGYTAGSKTITVTVK